MRLLSLLVIVPALLIASSVHADASPIPSSAYPAAAIISYQPSLDDAEYDAAWGDFHSGPSADAGRVAGIRLAISANHPVMVAFPVYRAYDNAAFQWLITSPTPTEQQTGPRGYHENVVVAYDDSLQFPGGTVGGLEFQNQWTFSWGQGG